MNTTTSPQGVTQIYPRDCFNCGEPMIPAAKGSFTLVCKPCDISENGTIQGRFPRNENSGGLWGDEMIPYLDHGDTNAPSPDTTGNHREPAPLARTENPQADGSTGGLPHPQGP